mgnify:CR=1 FL=1
MINETNAKYKFYISLVVIIMTLVLLITTLFVPLEGKSEYILLVAGGALGWCTRIVTDYTEDDE